MNNLNKPNASPLLSASLLTAPQNMRWLEACQWLETQGQAYCVATVVAHMGSVPRDSGSKIVITASGQYDTLGGGNLEYQIIQHTREKLRNACTQAGAQQLQTEIVRFALTADLAQCCGGAVQVLLEFFNVNTPRVAIFGAGHVSQSLSTILAQLPCHVTVFDSRKTWLSQCAVLGVHTQNLESSKQAIDSLSANTLVVIMTHDHALDYELTELALKRETLGFVGLIGSMSKSERFRFRLEQALPQRKMLNKLTCPIGHQDIQGKLPMQVAVSIAAQLMELMQQVENNAEQGEQSNASQQQWQKANQARKQLTKQTPQYSLNTASSQKEHHS